MHAASGRSLGKRGGLALASLLLAASAGCTSGGSDRPAVSLPSTTLAPAPEGGLGGPVVTFTGATPEVAGHRAATVALAQFASSLPPGCRPSTERSDAHLVSVRWDCPGRIAADTVTLDGAPVSLSNILQGGYQDYLSSVAAQQLSVQGVANPATGDLSTWYLTPTELAVVFPAGVVSYPLASLDGYLKDPAGL